MSIPWIVLNIWIVDAAPDYPEWSVVENLAILSM